MWHTNSSEIPDIDLRPPLNYWSCHDKESGSDPTGKRVSLHTPDGSNVDEIASHYHCDNFIDCENLSDESVGCVSNYLIIFIVFGAITAVLVFIAIAVLLFVILFGLILKYQRLRVASPFFLVLVLLSIIVGYLSIFTWFGKPHPVSCALQPWFLGLSVISMITALCAKVYRVWRIFRVKTTQKITDFNLLALWAVIMIPAVLIVTTWTIVSTPTARMEERDGEEHYVCTTGGFTGSPSGVIFFSILVAYGALVLLIGIFLSIVTRNVPSIFNESKLLAVSIYNLGFLSAVILPVIIVVEPFNPFITWILRTIAILYAFTATLFLQFAPPMFLIIFDDRMSNVNIAKQVIITASASHVAYNPKFSE